MNKEEESVVFNEILKHNIAKFFENAGRKGGTKTKELFGSEHYREIQKKGVIARRRNKKLRQQQKDA